MIVGYLDIDGDAVCAACWPARAEAGAWPLLILDSEDPLDPEHDFWVVDECTECGGEVEYLTALCRRAAMASASFSQAQSEIWEPFSDRS